MTLRLASAASALLLLALSASLPVSSRAWSLSSLIYGEEDSADVGAAGEGGSASDDSQRRKKRPRTKLPKILSRDVEASVAARSWPTTAASPLCEAWGFIDAGELGGDDVDEDSDAGGKGEPMMGRCEKWKWSYLDALSSADAAESSSALDAALRNGGSAGGWSYYSESIEAAVLAAGRSSEDGAEAFDSSLESRLLRYDLALRAHSPLCELHRTLARDAALASGLYEPSRIGGGAAGGELPGAFAVVYPGGLVSADPEEIVESFRSSSTSAKNDGNDEDDDAPLLPGEKPRIPPPKGSSGMIVLYGQWGSTPFSKLYAALRDAGVPFVARFMGAIDHEEKMEAGSDEASGTVLQGYGVRLDIRNMQYKVFDDKADSGVDDEDEEEEAESASAGDAAEGEGGEVAPKKKKPKKLRAEYLAGLNLTRLAERADAAASDPASDEGAEGGEEGAPLSSILSAIQSDLLIDSHHYSSHHSQNVPPAWQRRDLSLQAAAAVSSSVDPLLTLQDVAQNLPSYASALVELDVPDAIRAEASKLERLPVIVRNGGGEFGSRKGNAAQGQGSEGAFAFFVNGRRISVDRPSFNLFELMGVLREEDALLGRMEGELGPHFTGEGADGALGAVRDMIEMGSDALEKLGVESARKSDEPQDDDEGFLDDDDMDDDDDDDEGVGGGGGGGASGKFRIDVGRGYRGAVMYVNDVEKDPQYSQWPRSVQQMMMMSQYGGAPTVRRNLFTVLLVVDPTDASKGSARTLEVMVQMVQSNYPLRVGFLIVGEKDVEKCKEELGAGLDECAVKDARASGLANAHAAALLYQSIASEYGNMMALSWMNFVMAYWSEQADLMGVGPAGKKSTVGELIDAHAAFLDRAAQVSGSQARKDAIDALTKGDSDSDKADAVTYAKALKFAATKNVGPGMGFVNGIPLPTEDKSGGRDTQRIIMEEQRNIMGMIMGGKISDKGPRSIYAMLLTGSGVYSSMHPLLTESVGTYASPSHGFGERSLLRVPKDHDGDNNDDSALAASSSESADGEVKAGFVLEAHLDLSSGRGLALAGSFLRTMDALPANVGEDAVSAYYRLVPTSTFHAGLAELLSDAGTFGSDAVAKLIDIVGNEVATGDLEGDVAELLDGLVGVDDEVKAAMKKSLKKKILPAASGEELPSPNCLLANGRVLDLDAQSSGSIEPADVEILLTLEMNRARAVARKLGPHGASRDAMGRAAAFLGRLLSDKKGGGAKKRTDAEAQLRELGGSPLHFEWNNGGDEKEEGKSESVRGRRIQVKVTAILDPLSEPTQRLTPLLRAVRDQLKLPLRVVVAPRTMIGADDSLPVTSYYRFVADPLALPDSGLPKASFRNLPSNHVLTIRMDVPEPWNVQQAEAVQDTDNLRCDSGGCSDSEYIRNTLGGEGDSEEERNKDRSRIGLTRVEYTLSNLLFFGQCYDVTEGTPPNGLQLTMDQDSSSGLNLSDGLTSASVSKVSEVEISPDGSTSTSPDASALTGVATRGYHSDTLVMKTVGYWQLRAKPGMFTLTIANSTRGSEIYQMVEGDVTGGGIKIDPKSGAAETKTLVMKDFVNHGELLLVQKKKGFEHEELFSEEYDKALASKEEEDDDVIHVFSLATGHLYERFLKIMMLSVTKRTSSRVKFWLFENYLSPSFKASATAMAERIGCELAFVTYKWPEWLRGQTEKQRIIWGYKILFLDTLFPLDVKKIIYVDADQVVRGDLRELWDMDLKGAPYGYTPFCDSRETTLGFQFWRSGFWKNHLRDHPYHISALYVVDLQRFRRELVGDKLRQYYQQLSADAGSLANLDQDLPNYAQHDVRIHSLPQEWLWCESWCSDETKPAAKTIDLCNNPLHKEPKVSMAKRVISGELFEESWVELDGEVQKYEDEYRASLL